MPITNQFALLPPSAVYIDRDSRQRREISTKGLIDSIRARGVLQPIIVEGKPGADGRHQLIAGERRLTASIELELLSIPCRFIEDLDPIEAQIVELEENIKREDLPWQDIVRSVEEIHGLYVRLEASWTQQETADSIGLSPGIISMYLKVSGELGTERVQKATTVREAYNMLGRRDQRLAGEALQEILDAGQPDPVALAALFAGAPGVDGVVLYQDDPEASAELAVLPETDQPRGDGVGTAPGTHIILPRTVDGAPTGLMARSRLLPDAAKTILHESFLHWAPKYQGRKFNLIHCDFPYGVNLFAGPQGGGQDATAYDDTPEVYFRLLACLLDNLDRLMSVSGHLLFWYSEKHRDQTRELFATRAPSLVFQPFPLVWLKSDNAGIAADVRKGPRHVYETCLMATRGARQIVRVVADAYSAPTDKRFHTSTKPEPMLKHFLTMLVDEQTRVLDPTCGSGSVLRACEALGAAETLGLEVDEQTAGLARMALRQARTLREGRLV